MRALKKFPIILLVVIGFVLYLPSLFGQFVWDDEDFVYENTYVRDFRIDKLWTENAIAGRGKISNYYRPVQETLYASMHSLVGYTPFFYHLTNVMVHVAAGVAVYYFFLLLSGSSTVSWLIALIFLIHPVQTEAVSYISGLSDPLFVLFGFLSLIFYLKKQDHQLNYWMSVGCFFLSLLSKETGLVFLPLTLLIWLVKERKKALMLLPHVFVTAGYLLFHFAFINRDDIARAWGNNPYAHSVWIRLTAFFQNIFLYISLLLFPNNLFMERDYSISIPTYFLNPYTIGFIIFVIIGMSFLWWKRKTKIFPMLVFSFLGFFIAFVPYTGIVLINGMFYEHFLYLPLVFFFSFFLFIWEKHLRKSIVVGVLCFIIVVLSFRNLTRQWDWMDPVRFYQQTLVHAPKSIRIHNNLGMVYADRGNIDDAIVQYLAAVAIDPEVPNPYHNLGNAWKEKGDFQKAEEYYQKAIKVDPNFGFSYQSLFELYTKTGQTEKAQELLARYRQQTGPAQ